tara:strand:+ start:1000 stop:1128 length:129 start_codon:yes stop_codon:yes gene_type:complete
LIKFIENKANKFNLRKNDPNVKKVLAASVAVSVMESELENYK